MSDQDNDHKPLPASERKLRKAREDGQAVRSRDLGHFLVMLAAIAALIMLTPWWMERLQLLMNTGLRFDARIVASEDAMLERLSVWSSMALMVVIPLGAGIALAAVGAGVISGGWMLSFKVIAPNFGKLNPVSGIGNVFSKKQLIDALKASAMALALGAVGGMLLWKRWPDLVQLLAQPLPLAIHDMGDTFRQVLWTMLLVLAGFALIDWPLQRFMFMQRMRMTHQEVKDEYKQMEGNGEVKGRMRQIMREMARKRMLAAVPTADLVVMNPTHYAVALKYDEGTMGAPRVVAKGLDLLAFKIRDLATEHKVPVLEAPPLARALYAHCEIDHEVPMALYSAVAQVLAYVYQLKAALAGQAPLPGNMPDLDVPKDMDPNESPELKARLAASEAE
ncbi:MAG TPA: flagellar biosynthesis protein FlhB [Aquabacterium sp.]|uniref:flagellar biosynthesis protein FlhB n=1 Tax=Aquabacterium sp. TaxID=1872578 RepID=UPI002E30622E|nr:flagellar biosynthesis protein FlhB [Aquabacterium sp.]HEX5371206.1 flagellar biosynthesis protein FlhB [Aquabacterium sp.]